MPFTSKKQQAWANSVGKKKLGAKVVAEFNRETKGKRLPVRAPKKG